MVESIYLSSVLDPKNFQSTIRKTLKNIRTLAKEDFDAIAVSGNSGCLLVSIIAHRLRKNIVLIRKYNDGSHSSLMVEGPTTKKYIILDDLLCTGSTIKRIIKEIKSHNNPNAKCIGFYLYNEHRWCPDSDLIKN